MKGLDSPDILIGTRPVGPNHKPLIIAEVAQAHDGSLGIAHSYVDAIADAGADVAKFQTHIADAESTQDEEFRTPFSYEDRTRYEYWKRMEFLPEQWRDLAAHARDRGVMFLSSPFSIEAARLLEAADVRAWKVASGELNNRPLCKYMRASGKPVLISTGMFGWAGIDEAVQYFREKGSPVGLFQCTSAYPVKYDQVGLNVIDEMKRRYKAPVGLSDHSGAVFPSLAALARGADMVEVHVVFHKEMFGPDAVASITIEDLCWLVRARDAFWKMRTPVDKDAAADEMETMRSVFGRSLALRTPGAAGTLLTEDRLTLKKPGTGISYKDIDKVIGRRLRKAVPQDRLLSWSDLEETVE